ncbi:hypothetical protein H2198_001072 [Neophaeococcomyces mojaviensis]|uniref:Uncharacterized protein n=1 Tax=Neophaeococcomyces mojaviensis TaxID=3383035 RepID=A0ACC3AI52_9EURO|nr:hypothetical protein H2198_001072 [Knufia sp. JES_112]
MGDPLSVAASIIAVIQVTSQVVVFINEVRNAPKEQVQIAIEASNLLSLLTRLRYRVDEAQANEPWFEQVRKLGVKDGPLDQCASVLHEITSNIEKLQSSNKVRSAIMWKFKKEDFEEMRRVIERLLSMVKFALEDDLFKLSQAIKDDVTSLSGEVKRMQSVLEQRAQEEFASWLGIRDDSGIFDSACKKRTAGTGRWLIESSTYCAWRSSAPSSIWLYGGPGCGKTILSSLIVEDVLLHSNAAVAYFFFDFNEADKSSFDRLCRSLFLQVASQNAKALGLLKRLHDRSMGGQLQPRSNAVVSELKIALRSCGRCYLVLDALDECSSREEVLDFLEEVLTTSNLNLSVFLTSRKETDIEMQLSNSVKGKINIDQSLIDEDIRLYVHDRLKIDAKLKRWPADVQSEIENTLMDKAQGMYVEPLLILKRLQLTVPRFRWAFCQMDSLRRCLRPQALRTALTSLPKSLPETYDRIFADIEANGQLEDAIRILQWLCYSQRALRVADMIEVLAVDASGTFSSGNRLIDPQDVATICSSFITITPISTELARQLEKELGSEGDINTEGAPLGKQTCFTQVSLAHLSVQDYLVSPACRHYQYFQRSVCDAQMGELCLRYLKTVYEINDNAAPSNHRTNKTDNENEVIIELQGPILSHDVIKGHPFLTYCAWNWRRHLSGEGVRLSPEVVDFTIQMFEEMDLLWNQLYTYQPQNSGDKEIGIDPKYSPRRKDSSICQASSLGILPLVERLVERGDDILMIGSPYGTPLMCAETFRHDAVSKLLRAHGGDLNMRLKDGQIVKVIITPPDDEELPPPYSARA